MGQDEPAPDLRKLKQAALMAAEIMGLLLEALRQEFAAGRWAAYEAAKGFLDGPCGAWLGRASSLTREAPQDDEAELGNRLRGAFLDLERSCRAFVRLLHEEKRCRRDEVCAGEGLAPIQSHEENLKDLVGILRSMAPALSEPGLRQLIELADAPEPPENSRVAHPSARLAGLLLLDAGRRGASDIVVAPGSWVSLVQYRLGGVMVPILELSLPFHRALVARFKSMAGMDLGARKALPERLQGAAAAAEEEDAPRAMVRVLPTVHGERLDVHLQGPPKVILRPAELGFAKADLERFEALLAARSGLIVHAGPSGTGKRTAVLTGLATTALAGRDSCAVLSRQPFDAPGVTVSLTHAAAEHAALLRGVLERRAGAVGLDHLQNPELLAGALQAASQGALVLAALTRDGAVAALRHLCEEGADLSLVRSCLLAVCSHRLPRRLCACRKTGAASAREREALGGADADLKLGRPVGCPACLHTGFRGVVPVFELLVVGENLRDLLRPGVPDEDWLKAAQADGMRPFRLGLADLVREGATSFGEAMRWGLGA